MYEQQMLNKLPLNYGKRPSSGRYGGPLGSEKISEIDDIEDGTEGDAPAPSAAGDQAQPINVRAQSWTDHTNTSKEFPSKQRLAYTPGLRPLLEKNSPVAERKGEDSSGKARNSSDPGFKNKIEFVYNRLGQVVQKKKDDGKKFEEFYENSKPGYLPPPVDSDGHSYGDKEYNAPSPPERDVAGVDQQVLSQLKVKHA
nr:hypothetical protein BaRGS_021070 [Batillaria attramentaria]